MFAVGCTILPWTQVQVPQQPKDWARTKQWNASFKHVAKHSKRQRYTDLGGSLNDVYDLQDDLRSTMLKKHILGPMTYSPAGVLHMSTTIIHHSLTWEADGEKEESVRGRGKWMTETSKPGFGLGCFCFFKGACVSKNLFYTNTTNIVKYLHGT